MNSIKYDLYTTDDAVTPVAVDIVSGYQHNMAGNETTKTFYVKGYNVLGDNIDSNQDDGDALAPLLTITWTGMSESTPINISGGDIEFSNDGGSTWADITAGTTKWLNTGSGPYIINEKIKNTVTSCSLGGDATFSVHFNGSLVAVGGNLSGISYKYCNFLSIDISGLNINNITTLNESFSESALQNIFLPSDLSNINSLKYLFFDCDNLIDLDFSDKILKNGVDFSGFVSNCDNLVSVNLLNTNTSGVVSYNVAFSQTPSLVCISNLDTTNSTDKTNMFLSTPALIQPDATAQSDLIDVDGANWTNPNPCP